MGPLTPEEAFEYCLQNPDGLTIEQLLAKFPQYAQNLTQLLALHESLSTTLPGAQPPAGFDSLKARILSPTPRTNQTPASTPPPSPAQADDATLDRLLSRAEKRSPKPLTSAATDSPTSPNPPDPLDTN